MLRYGMVMLFGFGVMFEAFADDIQFDERPCTYEAMVKLNDYSPVEVYLNYFGEKENDAAVEEIRTVELSSDFNQKYRDELEQFELHHQDYQPSSSFCRDAYLEVDAAMKKVDDIAKKYGYPK